MMNSLSEIELAVGKLRLEEREELLAFVAGSLRAERGALPPVRDLSKEELESWIRDDEAEGAAFRAGQ